MSAVKELESKLNDVFVKNAPFQIPENGRKTLAQWLPWLAGIGAVLYAWSVWAFYRLFQVADSLGRFANELSRAYGGGDVYDNSIGALGWFWILTAAVQVALMAFAIPALLKRQKSGWDLLFYSELVGIVVSVVTLFRGANAGFGNLIFSLVGVVIGLYVLFQVRGQFTKTAK
jgi:hypothetical protein